MSYATVADMADDNDLQRRIAACVAQEVPSGDAQRWAKDNQLRLAGADDAWTTAWVKAVKAGSAKPGADEKVITDHMIRKAVRAALELPDDPADDAG